MARVVRPITADEFAEFLALDLAAFGLEPPRDTATGDGWRTGELDRTRACFDDGEMVGVGRNYTFDLTVPGGGRVPVGAVSWIAVSPLHRRRGAMTDVMAALIADSADRGELASVLTASEGGIYRRLGYGPATWAATAELRGARLREPVDDRRVRFITRSETDAVLPPIYERSRAGAVGSVSRPAIWWPARIDRWTADGNHHAWVVHTDDHGVDDGYVAYAITGDWDDHGVPEKRVEIVDMVTATPAAHRSLWTYLLGIDLAPTVVIDKLALDDPLRHLLVDPRSLRITAVVDLLWIRPIDACGLLAARTFADCRSRVSAAITGPGPGVALVIDADGCTAHRGPVDLSMGSAELGSIVLGGVSASSLVAAGLVTESRIGAAADADDLLGVRPAPFMATNF